MTRRTHTLFLLVVLGALAAAAAPASAAAESFVDKQVEMNVLLLQGYINTQAEKNGFVYPAVDDVKKGGALAAPVWPGNPWTGGTMAPGTTKGTYTYRVKADLSGYVLIGHLSKGSFKVTGGVPAWLGDERDASAKAGLALVQQYVEVWARGHGGSPPTEADVSSVGAVGLQPGVALWPQNPWSHSGMAQGTAAGDFTYTVSGGGYTLAVHLTAGKDFALSGGAR